MLLAVFASTCDATRVIAPSASTPPPNVPALPKKPSLVAVLPVTVVLSSTSALAARMPPPSATPATGGSPVAEMLLPLTVDDLLVRSVATSPPPCAATDEPCTSIVLPSIVEPVTCMVSSANTPPPLPRADAAPRFDVAWIPLCSTVVSSSCAFVAYAPPPNTGTFVPPVALAVLSLIAEPVVESVPPA